MGFLGWGSATDDSTPEQRAEWKANAERQMDDQNSDDNDDGDTTPRHRRARNPR